MEPKHWECIRKFVKLGKGVEELTGRTVPRRLGTSVDLFRDSLRRVKDVSDEQIREQELDPGELRNLLQLYWKSRGKELSNLHVEALKKFSELPEEDAMLLRRRGIQDKLGTSFNTFRNVMELVWKLSDEEFRSRGIDPKKFRKTREIYNKYKGMPSASLKIFQKVDPVEMVFELMRHMNISKVAEMHEKEGATRYIVKETMKKILENPGAYGFKEKSNELEFMRHLLTMAEERRVGGQITDPNTSFRILKMAVETDKDYNRIAKDMEKAGVSTSRSKVQDLVSRAAKAVQKHPELFRKIKKTGERLEIEKGLAERDKFFLRIPEPERYFTKEEVIKAAEKRKTHEFSLDEIQEIMKDVIRTCSVGYATDKRKLSTHTVWNNMKKWKKEPERYGISPDQLKFIKFLFEKDRPMGWRTATEPELAFKILKEAVSTSKSYSQISDETGVGINTVQKIVREAEKLARKYPNVFGKELTVDERICLEKEIREEANKHFLRSKFPEFMTAKQLKRAVEIRRSRGAKVDGRINRKKVMSMRRSLAIKRLNKLIGLLGSRPGFKELLRQIKEADVRDLSQHSRIEEILEKTRGLEKRYEGILIREEMPKPTALPQERYDELARSPRGMAIKAVHMEDLSEEEKAAIAEEIIKSGFPIKVFSPEKMGWEEVRVTSLARLSEVTKKDRGARRAKLWGFGNRFFMQRLMLERK